MVAKYKIPHIIFSKISPLDVLYFVYVCFFISIFLTSSETAMWQALCSLVGMSALTSMLLIHREFISMSLWKFLLINFLFGFSFILLFQTRDYYTVLMYAQIMIFILFFSKYKIQKSDFISFVNKTYLVYLTLSVLIWLGSANGSIAGNYNDEFHVTFGLFDYFMLFGIEGGSAFIDTYSALVLILNVFLNEARDRKLIIFASLFGILASFKMTPIVSLIAIFLLYPIYKKSRFLASIIMIFIGLVFLWLLNALLHSDFVTINGQQVDVWVLAYGLTHARSMIWKQQIEILIANYDLIDYLFGRYSTGLFEVQAIQQWGELKEEFHANPHNTYLLLFFRSPFLFVIFFTIFFIAQFKKFDRSTFPVILLIFLSSFTNSSLIGLGNPIYLMTLIYLLTFSNLPKQIMSVESSSNQHKVISYG